MKSRWLVAVALSVSCSAFGVKGPHGAGTADAPPPCTRSYPLPAVDTLATIAVLVAAYGAATFNYPPCSDCPVDWGDFAVVAIFAAPFAVSAGVGIHRIDRCEHAQEAWRAERAPPAGPAGAAPECHETSPGSRMWTCGPGYRCTPDHSACDALPAR